MEIERGIRIGVYFEVELIQVAPELYVRHKSKINQGKTSFCSGQLDEW